MSITSPLDKWAAAWPFIALRLYVDDLSLHVIGTPAFIAQHLHKSIAHLIKLLDEHSGADVSGGGFGVVGGKSLVLAREPSLREAMGAQFVQLGICVVGCARNLGTDYAAGGPVP